jgi:hypothetical protein
VALEYLQGLANSGFDAQSLGAEKLLLLAGRLVTIVMEFYS